LQRECYPVFPCGAESIPRTPAEEKIMLVVLRLLALAGILTALPTIAAEVGGVKFEEKMKVGTTELILNGAGVRTRAFFKVYSIGLYLPEKRNTAEGVIGLKGAKRIEIVTLRDLTAQQFADALVERIEANHSAAELAALKPAVDEFRAALLALNAAPKGTSIAIDYAPESGTRLSVNDQVRGKPIAGEEFYRALLRIWLGEKPAQSDLKEALLGKTG
jgi:chalcone isomerase-like protein